MAHMCVGTREPGSPSLETTKSSFLTVPKPWCWGKMFEKIPHRILRQKFAEISATILLVRGEIRAHGQLSGVYVRIKSNSGPLVNLSKWTHR